MTQEEKAKEFDASLERAKKLIETCDSTAVIGWCEYIFPMLRESEYERIRKGMLQGFKDYGEPEYVWWEGVKVKECIAWLEKQGEQKELSQSKVTKISDQDEMATDIAIKPLNHNIVNDSYCKENCKGYQETGKCYADWDCEAKRKAEQNLAWSEEDDYNVQCCIAKAVADMQTGNVGRNNELIEWLKSLKERLSL